MFGRANRLGTTLRCMRVFITYIEPRIKYTSAHSASLLHRSAPGTLHTPQHPSTCCTHYCHRMLSEPLSIPHEALAFSRLYDCQCHLLPQNPLSRPVAGGGLLYPRHSDLHVHCAGGPQPLPNFRYMHCWPLPTTRRGSRRYAGSIDDFPNAGQPHHFPAAHRHTHTCVRSCFVKQSTFLI